MFELPREVAYLPSTNQEVFEAKLGNGYVPTPSGRKLGEKEDGRSLGES